MQLFLCCLYSTVNYLSQFSNCIRNVGSAVIHQVQNHTTFRPAVLLILTIHLYFVICSGQRASSSMSGTLSVCVTLTMSQDLSSSFIRRCGGRICSSLLPRSFIMVQLMWSLPHAQLQYSDVHSVLTSASAASPFYPNTNNHQQTWSNILTNYFFCTQTNIYLPVCLWSPAAATIPQIVCISCVPSVPILEVKFSVISVCCLYCKDQEVHL